MDKQQVEERVLEYLKGKFGAELTLQGTQYRLQMNIYPMLPVKYLHNAPIEAACEMLEKVKGMVVEHLNQEIVMIRGLRGD